MKITTNFVKMAGLRVSGIRERSANHLATTFGMKVLIVVLVFEERFNHSTK
jgi:hypothetical protein